MKIAILQSSLWLSGGAWVVVEYANRLSARGHQVSVVIPKDAISPDLAGALSEKVTISYARYPLTKPISWLAKLRLIWAMARAVPACDIILTTHTPTTLVSLLAHKVFGRGVPIWLYMDYPTMFSERPMEKWLLRNAMRWHRAALTISNNLAREIPPAFAQKVYYVGLGLSQAELLKPLPRPAGEETQKKTILYLGDFRPRKGLNDFLEAVHLAAQHIPGIELWLALKESAEGKIQSSLPMRYIYHPSTMQLAELYATCDLFVSASWHEGFGLPPLEAMSCGAAVVTTDSGGVRDYARHGENCLVVPVRSPALMAQAIQEVLSNPALAEKFRQTGPATAAEYDWEKATDRLESILVKMGA